MPDVPTTTEYIRRIKAIEALRQFWLASEFDPALRDMVFPVGIEPGDTWRAHPLDDEDTAVARGVVAVWPE